MLLIEDYLKMPFLPSLPVLCIYWPSAVFTIVADHLGHENEQQLQSL